MTKPNERANPGIKDRKLVTELDEAALDRAAGGVQNEPTKHPAKVTIPDLKLSVS